MNHTSFTENEFEILEKSILIDTDGYKFSHLFMLIPGTTNESAYIAPRGGDWEQIVHFGPQMFFKKYLSRPITKEEVEVATKFALMQGTSFNSEGYQYIVDKHQGKLPIRIKSLPEGTVVNPKTIVGTIEVTDPTCSWLVSPLESPLLRAFWYPSTVATRAFNAKRIIKNYLNKTGTPEILDYKVADFGLRGVSSKESAGIGGAAHLTSFKISDNNTGALWAMRYYNEDVTQTTIDATQHSISCQWKQDDEEDYVRHILRVCGKKGALFAIVADTYDVYEFCHKVGSLREEIEATESTLILRPDSGFPPEVALGCITILDSYFGTTINEKGYHVLNTVRLIYGDSIDCSMIDRVLYKLSVNGYSADNITFGWGHKLLQEAARDDHQYAQKTSAMERNGQWIGQRKKPATAAGKSSLEGRYSVVQKEDGRFLNVRNDNDEYLPNDILLPHFENGELLIDYNLSEIRETINSYLN
jgi:nicotinamide phosphoribosyltransferase